MTRSSGVTPPHALDQLGRTSSPRHLGGAGLDRLTDALSPLIHLFGWPRSATPRPGASPSTAPTAASSSTSPPSDPAGRWWTVAHHEPYWEVQFCRQTPIEAIAAVTQALLQIVGDTRHAERILTASTLTETANLSAWTTTTEGPATVFTSPDERCRPVHEPDTEVPWRFEHSLFDGFDTHWTATFTRDAAEQLVAQFFAHLASNDPVERVFNEVPFLVQLDDSALVTPASGATVNPHAHHSVAQPARHADRHPRR
ncbi:DUF317 domain-containing protein [Streptomyces sp. NPDC058391]|uniref:DUF317 domain-containing protein n=1 Tax=Streptomyces sp. NPDC058391 TaxID=3346476 RepID=UPI0036664706